MGVLEDKIKAMGYQLPEPFKFPNPNRTGCVVVGSVIFVSGHGRDMSGPNVKAKGKLEHVPPELNRQDSQRLLDRRFYRH
jgi:hypothetical protein